jgi:hypothetical protein
MQIEHHHNIVKSAYKRERAGRKLGLASRKACSLSVFLEITESRTGSQVVLSFAPGKLFLNHPCRLYRTSKRMKYLLHCRKSLFNESFQS